MTADSVPPDRPAIGVGVVGLGFMGRTHVAAYVGASRAGFPCRLVAVCDSDPRRRAGEAGESGNLQTGAAAFDPASVRAHGCFESMLADPDVRLISICTPTQTHVELASAALRAGKHVLVEKPVAITTEPIRELRAVAAEAKTLIMPAMCMRFWPAWSWLKDAMDSGRYGRLRALNLQRIGAAPAWSAWFADPAASGGAMVDLHIHDVDFIRFCLGRPSAVTSGGHLNHVTTMYHFDDPSLHVTAQGGWLAPGTPFRMRYLAEFEQATADFDLSRSDQLLLHHKGSSEPIDVGSLTGYDLEVRHFVQAVAMLESPGSAPAVHHAPASAASHAAAGSRPAAPSPGATRPTLRATLDDAIDVAILLETEQYAVECGRRVQIMWGVEEPPGH